jgi:hypothetical protein
MDLFGILWLGLVAVFVAAQGAWFMRALRTGVVTYYFRYDFFREQEPFKFWMLTAGRGLAILFGLAMFALGLQFWVV